MQEWYTTREVAGLVGKSYANFGQFLVVNSKARALRIEGIAKGLIKQQKYNEGKGLSFVYHHSLIERFKQIADERRQSKEAIEILLPIPVEVICEL